jgi:hypothetical protein
MTSALDGQVEYHRIKADAGARALMNDRLKILREWMDAREDEHLEFKEAKTNFHFEKLVDYCVALANEGGGKIIFGVTDKRPRRVVGSQAFQELRGGDLFYLHRRLRGLVDSAWGDAG